ncbi:MAG: hypothetical protein LAN18_11040 [Acidobacteriia bacterium]|nr:hypothetical protein [Terriglobia bacterium]
MKTLGKIIVGILVCLVLALLVLRVTGLNPKGRRPGLWLSGDVVTTPVADWSFTDKYPNIMIQTRTWYMIPHSVTINCLSANGQLYLSTAIPAGLQYPHDRNWHANVARDPHARLKIGNQLYDRTLSVVTDPAEKAAVMQAREKKYPQLKVPANGTLVVFHVLDN